MTERKTSKKKFEGDDTNGFTGSGRVEVIKTYKLYIGGQFPRTESGRYLPVLQRDSRVINVCQASRKDLRNAVVSATNALKTWRSRTAYNRSQILYRIAEMLEGRKQQFVQDLIQEGLTPKKALVEIERSIDCIIHYSGWCDKYLQLFSTVNPVADSYFNFSVPEPVGVVGIITDTKGNLYSLVSTLVPVLAGSNTAVLLVPPSAVVSALNFAEVLETSDIPAGTVNILTGQIDELLYHFGTHLDIHTVVFETSDESLISELRQLAATHVLRVINRTPGNVVEGPYKIMETQEVKTTWHPVGK